MDTPRGAQIFGSSLRKWQMRTQVEREASRELESTAFLAELGRFGCDWGQLPPVSPGELGRRPQGTRFHAGYSRPQFLAVPPIPLAGLPSRDYRVRVIALQVAVGIVLGVLFLGWLARPRVLVEPELPEHLRPLPGEKPGATLTRIQDAAGYRTHGA